MNDKLILHRGKTLKKCLLCKKEITDKKFQYCPWCGGDWKHGLTQDRNMVDRDRVIPKLEKARNKSTGDEKDRYYLDGIIDGINWSFNHSVTYSTVSILEKKYKIDLDNI